MSWSRGLLVKEVHQLDGGCGGGLWMGYRRVVYKFKGCK